MIDQPLRPHEALPETLATLLQDLSPIALAFSGGLDSRFLAYAAHLLHGGKAMDGQPGPAAPSGGPEIHLFHATGPHVPGQESAEAKAWADSLGLGITLLPVDPLRSEAVRTNSRERCYHCKRLIFSRLAEAAADHPFSAPPTLCDGSNASDALLYRPGTKALRELGVRSPLAEAGLDKKTLRMLAALTGMDRPRQAARPCLFTRFAYDLACTPVALAALERAESDIGRILSEAFPGSAMPEYRLRLPGLLPQAGAEARAGLLPYVAELQLGARPDRSTADRLKLAVQAQGFAEPGLVILDAVSGYYDRARSAST